MVITPDRIKITFGTRPSYAPDRIPLPLGQGQGGGGGNQPVLRIVPIRGCSQGRDSASVDIHGCVSHRQTAAPIGDCLAAGNSPTVDISQCHQARTANPPPIRKCTTSSIADGIAMANCQRSRTQAGERLKHCAGPQVTPSVLLISCLPQPIQHAQALHNCRDNRVTPSYLLINCAGHRRLGTPLKNCRHNQYQHAVRPPCEYYPIPLPPPPPDWSPCRIRPPSDRLPLPLTRLRIRRDSQRLRLPLTCWHDNDSNDLPILPGYIMHNTITAEHNGKPLQILSLNLTTDVNSYCWQADIQLAPHDFAALNMDGRAKGDEAVITLRINNRRWDILAEDYRDTRRFIGLSYTVTGRSTTAKLGADYAQGKHTRYNSPRYARQIADEQLHLLPYQISAWEAVDWLIPADAYTVSGQTPIDVIADLAKAAGAFVESHPFEPQLMIKPVWNKAAWENVSPTHTIPANLILSVSGQRRVSEQCNGVRIAGSGAGARGALVYRSGSNQTPEAAILTHPAYTDDIVLRTAGIAALSETGTHKMETVTLPWAEKYQLPLAELGKVWAFAENGHTWQGVIKGITVEVALENDAPTVTQSVVIDRYLGE